MRSRPPDARRLAAAALVLLAWSASACSNGSSATPPKPEAVPVLTGKAETKDVPVQIQEMGTVEPLATVEVKALVAGQLQKVHFREGQEVRRGALLFTIDPQPYEAEAASAKAALARDKAMLQNAKAEVARYEGLVKKDYVTPEEFDARRANVEALEATVSAGEAAVKSAELNLGYCTIRSPIDGRTGKLMVHEGNLVKANADTGLVTIHQVAPIYVSFSVPEQSLSQIQQRQAMNALAVHATVPGQSDEPMSGVLTFIDNNIDRQTGTFLLKATFANPDHRLWPGQFVNATMDVDVKRSATLVPTEAIQRGQQGAFVFVVKPDMTVESRPVKTAGTFEHSTIVDEGLSGGETVVTDGQLRLGPGSTVEVRQSLETEAAKRP